MARSPITQQDILNPSRLLDNMINDYIAGKLDGNNVIYRVSVTKVDMEGGKLRKDPANPRNSIQGRIVSGRFNRATPDEDLPVFWPLFPFDVMPIKEGEEVYVLFEDAIHKKHGLWITRVPENNNIDNRNLVLGSKKYEKELQDSVLAEGLAQGALVKVKKAVQSKDFAIEVDDIPPFLFRTGDRGLEGSNNTLVLMSRDRNDTIDSGTEKKAGAIFLVAGRTKPKELDLESDNSMLVVSMMSDMDSNMKIEAGKSAGASAVIAAKSDEIRIVARKGMKIVVSGDGDLHIESGGEIQIKTPGKVKIDAGTVDVGGNDGPGVLGDKLEILWTKLSTELTKWSSSVVYSTAMGPTIGPGIPPLQPPGWDSSVNSGTVKIKK